MKLLIAYAGKNEWRCFIGSSKVGEVHVIEGWHFPMATVNGVTRFGRSLRSMEGARAWIQMTLREMGKTK